MSDPEGFKTIKLCKQAGMAIISRPSAGQNCMLCSRTASLNQDGESLKQTANLSVILISIIITWGSVRPGPGGLSPLKCRYFPTVKHAGQELRGELCEILKF